MYEHAVDQDRIATSNDSRGLTPPCQAACPLHMDIREYVDLVAQGRIMEALRIIRTGNPFPSICAYICNHACEDKCRRAQADHPLAIRALKRFAVEFGGDRMVQAEAETTHPEKVAVVGSGPAGMACAYYLRKLGYPVTVFEAHSEVGGMLRAGIPQYRLPAAVLDNEVQRLVSMGVEFRTNTSVVSLALVFELGYKAIFVTVGAQQSRRLGVAGEDKPGMVDAITFLREVNLGLRPAIGDRVLVIGGGNVAVDAARCALRLGARSVSMACLESREEMPAFKSDIHDALEEGVKINCSWGVRSVLGESAVTGMELKKCTAVFDANKRFNPTFDDSQTTKIEANTVITAIGQVPQVPGDFHLRIGRGSSIQVDPVTLSTNRPGVFAGGDAVTGPATAVQALATGRLAARRIDDYLQHRYPRPTEEDSRSPIGELAPRTIELIRKTARLEPPATSPETRVQEFKPVEQVYNWEDAVNEARRCLRCGIGAQVMFQDKCATCLTCLWVCPYEVPYLDNTGTLRIPADQCQACGICVGECPAKAITLRKPTDRRQIDEELDHLVKSAPGPKSKPMVIGFCCQYGLFGTGTLAGLSSRARAGVWIVPVLCVAKVEAEHLLRAFELGAQGVFVAGCGENCSRENTATWLRERVHRVRKALTALGIPADHVQVFLPGPKEDPAKEMDQFLDRMAGSYLDSIVKQEVKGDSRRAKAS
ncbi:MAG: FAD-dependent oxidoreductase [Chloroflexi bacterium]|nr:FAD-dependent oxidoreductase [Chloroflexota bacterium]